MKRTNVKKLHGLLYQDNLSWEETRKVLRRLGAREIKPDGSIVPGSGSSARELFNSTMALHAIGQEVK